MKDRLLFTGFTRPATKFGIPMVALAIIVYLTIMAYITTESLYAFLFLGLAYSAVRLTMLYDIRFFDILLSRVAFLFKIPKFGNSVLNRTLEP